MCLFLPNKLLIMLFLHKVNGMELWWYLNESRKLLDAMQCGEIVAIQVDRSNVEPPSTDGGYLWDFA